MDAPRSLAASWTVPVALAVLAAAGAPASAQAPARAGGAAAGAAGEVWLYRIERGDTLIGLRDRYLRPDADWRIVQRLNRIADPRRLVPGSTLRIPLALLRGEPVRAEVLHVHGEVLVERGGTRAPLAAAADVGEGDLIVTGAQSSASLRFADGSRTLIGPDTRLRIERHARLGRRDAATPTDTRLKLDAGAVENRVVPARPAPRFELGTPVISLGVRGTEFRARTDGQRAQAEVLEGRVAAAPTALEAGFGAVAEGNRVGAPVALPAAPELASWPALVERLPLRLALPPLPPGAAAWHAQVFEAGEPERLLLSGRFDATAAAFPASPPDARYLLRLRAVRADGIEGRTATHAFTLRARPEPPFLLQPRTDESLTSERVTFAWSRNPDAARYRLQVARAGSDDFADPLVDRADLADTELALTLPVGRYAWRVASMRADGSTGPWGDPSRLVRVEPPPPPPPPPPGTPQKTDAGVLLRWSAVNEPGVRYQVQVARDAGFTTLLLDDTTPDAERLLARPEPGEYHVRVRSIAPDGRPGPWGTTQIVEVPRSWWWLWLLPLLLLL